MSVVSQFAQKRTILSVALILVLAGIGMAAPFPIAAQPGPADAVPEVIEGFTIAPLAAGTGITDLAFGPGGADGQDLYASDAAGNVWRYELTWTPGGPVLDDASIFASGFGLALGLAFDAHGDLVVATSGNDADAGRTVGRVIHVDLGTGTRTTIVDGLPNGQHNTNQLRIDNDGRLWMPNGNPNDHGNGTGTGHSDIFPVSGAFLSVEIDTVVAAPAVFRWADDAGGRIPDDDLVTHEVNEDFFDKVTVEAWGFRNIFGVAFASDDHPFAGAAFTGMNGADDPSSQDSFYQIQNGTDHGYPFCYAVGEPGAVGDDVSLVQAPNTPNPNRTCDEVPVPTALLGWHICATGLDLPVAGPGGLLDATFPGEFFQSAYVAECGPFFAFDTPEQQGGTSHRNTGHKVTRIGLDEDGNATGVHDFVSGLALPTAVLSAPDGSLIIGDIEAIYRVVPLPVQADTEIIPEPEDLVPDVAPEVFVAAATFQFGPAAIVVPAGTKVTWVSDILTHTVTTSDDQCVPFVANSACRPNDPANDDGDDATINAGLGGLGSTASAQFDEPGVYPYYCSLHRGVGMVGTIVVV